MGERRRDRQGEDWSCSIFVGEGTYSAFHGWQITRIFLLFSQMYSVHYNCELCFDDREMFAVLLAHLKTIATDLNINEKILLGQILKLARP